MRVFILINVLVLTGCYEFAPIGLNDLKAGTEVRVRVSREEALQLGVGDVSGRGDHLLTGQLLRWDDDTLAISVTEKGWTSAYAAVREHREFVIPMSAILELDRKHAHSGKTAVLMGGGFAALAFVIANRLSAKGDARGGLPPDVGDASLVRPLPR